MQVAVVPDIDNSELHSRVYEYAGASGGITAADAIFPTAKDVERTIAQRKDASFLTN